MRERHPAKGSFFPVGWSQEGNYVYLVQNWSVGRVEPLIYQIRADGGPVEKYLDLELTEELSWLEFAADGKFLVVETARELSDVWIAENFDPDVN